MLCNVIDILSQHFIQQHGVAADLTMEIIDKSIDVCGTLRAIIS